MVVGDSVAFVAVGVVTVAFVEALTELIELKFVVAFPSVAFCKEVPLTSDPFVTVVFRD